MNKYLYYERYWKEKMARENRGDCELIVKKQVKVNLARIPKSGLVLDAGCGDGEMIPFLSEMGFKVVGIDISLTAIVNGKKSL